MRYITLGLSDLYFNYLQLSDDMKTKHRQNDEWYVKNVLKKIKNV